MVGRVLTVVIVVVVVVNSRFTVLGIQAPSPHLCSVTVFHVAPSLKQRVVIRIFRTWGGTRRNFRSGRYRFGTPGSPTNQLRIGWSKPGKVDASGSGHRHLWQPLTARSPHHCPFGSGLHLVEHSRA